MATVYGSWRAHNSLSFHPLTFSYSLSRLVFPLKDRVGRQNYVIQQRPTASLEPKQHHSGKLRARNSSRAWS